MDFPSYHLPFTVPSIGMGLQAMSGIAHFKKDTLRIEYELKDAILGVVKSAPREASLTVAQLLRVTMRRKLFGAKLEIQTRSLAELADIPGSEAGRLVLHVKRRDRNTAERMASTISLRISEHNLSLDL